MVKAVLCKKYGPPETLVLEEVPSKNASAGEVVVSVLACGVNFPDCLIIENKYQFKPPLPFSPGGEVAGIVKEVGEGVQGYAVGDKVIAMVGWGGYADELVVDSHKLMHLPKGMDAVTGSGYTMTYGTSYHALKQRAQLQPGETVLVLGAAGGVGLACIDIAKAMGATVIAAASTQAKLDTCKKFGADHVINYSTQNLRKEVKKITDGQGVDVVYDPVGGDFAEPAVRSLGWKGRYLVIGFAAGGIPKIPLNLYLLKGAAAVGVFWGSFTFREPEANAQNMQELAEWYAQGKIKPYVSATYPLAEAASALNDMMGRKVQGKVVLVTDAYQKAASKL